MLYNPRSVKKGLVKSRKGITPMCGGAILLNKGGAGVGSSYPSVEEYHRITGCGLSEKIKSLMVKPIASKKKNIKFDM